MSVNVIIALFSVGKHFLETDTSSLGQTASLITPNVPWLSQCVKFYLYRSGAEVDKVTLEVELDTVLLASFNSSNTADNTWSHLAVEVPVILEVCVYHH